jgi:hypothetical protein
MRNQKSHCSGSDVLFEIEYAFERMGMKVMIAPSHELWEPGTKCQCARMMVLTEQWYGCLNGSYYHFD